MRFGDNMKIYYDEENDVLVNFHNIVKIYIEESFFVSLGSPYNKTSLGFSVESKCIKTANNVCLYYYSNENGGLDAAKKKLQELNAFLQHP